MQHTQPAIYDDRVIDGVLVQAHGGRIYRMTVLDYRGKCVNDATAPIAAGWLRADELAERGLIGKHKYTPGPSYYLI